MALASLIGCILAALLLSVFSPRRSEHTPVDTANASPVIRGLLPEEQAFLEDARITFPGDRWSQNDHFHHQIRKWVRRASKASGLSVGALLCAIDEDIRNHPTVDRQSGATPCKPRPFYD